METRRDDDTALSFITGLLLGLMVSAPVVAWLSPHSGPPTRQAIKQRGVIIRRRVKDTLRGPAEQVREGLDQLRRDPIADALAEGKAIAHQVHQQAREPRF